MTEHAMTSQAPPKEGEHDSDTDAFRNEMLGALPSLRAFAVSLSRNVAQADDLVQETILRAWTHRESFTMGTNMPAWLFTILHNTYRSDYRKRRREVEDADGGFVERLSQAPEQDGKIELRDMRKALDQLPDDQREALLLVGASGFSYEEAARICGCALGTVKSRVNRGRTRLAELLAIKTSADFGPSAETLAVVRDPSSSR